MDVESPPPHTVPTHSHEALPRGLELLQEPRGVRHLLAAAIAHGTVYFRGKVRLQLQENQMMWLGNIGVGRSTSNIPFLVPLKL